MNDLAEKALRGVVAVQSRVAARPATALAAAGFLAGTAVVLAGGVVAAVRPTRSLSSWFGLERAAGARLGQAAPGWWLVVATAVLVLVWVAAVALVRRGVVGLGPLRWVAVAWAVPFALGPPLLDTAVYRSAAYGFLQRAGRDPYETGPAALGDVPVVGAVDPAYRGTPSGSGPLGSLLQHVAVSAGGGSALAAVVVLRAVAAVSVLVLARLAVRLSDERPAQALALVALNPLVLLTVLSSPHLDGPMLALLLGALVVARAGRWDAAVALAALAGSVSGVAFVAVPVLVAAHAARAPRGRRAVAVGRDALVAVVVTVAVALTRPDGVGWVRTLGDQFSVHTPYSVSSALATALTPVISWASYDDLQASGRITALAAAASVLAYLVVTAGARTVARTVGYALLALALLAPSLQPWYLLWGTLPLVADADRAHRRAVVALTAAACALVPPGLGPVAAALATGTQLVVVASVVLVLLWRDRRSAPAADLADGGTHVGEVDAGHDDRDQREDVHHGRG